MSHSWFLRGIWALTGGGFLFAAPSRPGEFGWVDFTIFVLLGIACLAPALPSFPRRAEAPVIREPDGTIVLALTLRHRLARAVMWGGFTLVGIVVTLNSIGAELWEIAIGAGVTLLLVRPTVRAVRALADERQGAVLLTADGISLDGGRRWTTWDELDFVLVMAYSQPPVLPALELHRPSGRRRYRLETALPLRAADLKHLIDRRHTELR